MPTIPECLNLAEEALGAGDLDRARFVYEQILKAVPDEPSSLNGLGVVAMRAGRLEEAESYHLRAIAVFAGNPVYHNNLNLVYCRQGRAQEAVACCRRALELDANSAGLHNNLGLALKACGELEPAVDSFQRAVQLAPDGADAYYNLANVLVQLHRLDEANGAFRRAIALAPADVESHNNLGALLQLQGEFPEAMAAFDAALGFNPDFAEAHRNRAYLRLLLGDYAGGWQEYEWRWRVPGAVRPEFVQPRWRGEPLGGRTILVWCEQGMGDIIHMVRYAAPLAQAGARVLVQCRPSLHALLSTAAGVDRCVNFTAAAGAENFDYYIPLMSLPAALGTTLETIPAASAYLSADPQRSEHWKDKLKSLSSDSSSLQPPAFLRVGIAWQGNPEYSGDYYRSIPLSEFAPLAQCAGVRLFSLQKGPGHEQLAPLAERLRIVDLGAALDLGSDAFVDTAAATKHLDLVISCDTAIEHLAGALGVPAWIALQYSPNWRWHLNRQDSPWYPKTRLFRQPRFGDWTATFAQIAQALTSLSSQRTVG